MALGLIRIEGRLARGLLFTGLVVSVGIAGTFAKWCFANAVSPRSASKEVAELTTLLAPNDPQTHFSAAVLYEKTFLPEDIERSLQEYEAAASLSPNNYLAWIELGKARGRNGDITGAESAFLRTLELAPNYADVHWAYGNLLLRAGRTDEGFEQIRIAVAGNPELTSSAATTAMALFDGRSESARQALGNSGAVNAALTMFALGRKQTDEAVADWNQIPADEKRKKFSDTGRTLSTRLAEAGQFRSAVAVARDVWDEPDAGPSVGRLLNGDFESPVRLKNARTFDWQIAAGAEPQIAVTDTQKHGGSLSLYMIFSALEAADFRQISQTVAVEPGAAYTFEVYYRSELKGAVAWEIVGAADGKVLGRTGPIQSVPEWAAAKIFFTVPPSADGVTVRLVRDGCVSSVCPISGKAWFDDLALTKREATQQDM